MHDDCVQVYDHDICLQRPNKEYNGWTPLHLLATHCESFDSFDIFDYFFEHGADLTARTDSVSFV